MTDSTDGPIRDRRYWCVYCVEDSWPGLWRQWERRQIFTVGYPNDPDRGKGTGWSRVRSKLASMQAGDWVVARLPRHRIGRIGRVVEPWRMGAPWTPIVPSTSYSRRGEQGRHVLVRWDFSKGPDDPGFASTIPPALRKPLAMPPQTTIAELDKSRFEKLSQILTDSRTWEPASGSQFRLEKVLSDYIGQFPERLAPGLQPYPHRQTREMSMPDGGRVDVLLSDQEQRPVVVECKQSPATSEHIRQLRRYMRALPKHLGTTAKPRGILVCGGPALADEAVRELARQDPQVEIVSHRLEVRFQRIV